MTRKTMTLIAVTGGLLLSGFAAQADEYPTRDIRFVVPYPGGGITDLVGRIMANGLSEQLGGATVIVENRDGGTGIIGMNEVAQSPSDGYTILVSGLGGQVIPAYVNPNFPFEAGEDFEPLSTVAELVNVMIVNRDMPVDTVEEFIEYALERPGELHFGSAGIGATSHLAAAMFMQETGIDMVHVPYRGGAASLAELRGGVIDVVFENMPTVLGTIQAGEVKALAVTSENRSPQLPDLPTISESGVEGFNVTSWIMLFVNKGTPEALVEQLGDLLAAAADTPVVAERLQNLGFEPVGTNAAEAREFYRAEHEMWSAFFETQDLEMQQ